MTTYVESSLKDSLVQDIAEPLPSFDGTTLCEHVREIMSNKGFEVAGVRGEGITTGFVELSGLRERLLRRCCGATI